MRPGDIFRFPLSDSHTGMGQILGLHGDTACLAISAGVWECDPSLAKYIETDTALDHIPVRRSALDQVEWVGSHMIPEASKAAYEAWVAEPVGSRPVIDAPLVALLSALLDLSTQLE